MSIKLIACDMDETLLNNDHKICQENLDAIRQAVSEYNVRFVPATGRGYSSIQHNLKELDLYGRAGEYVISFNGGLITENKGNRTIRFKSLTFDQAQQLFQCGVEHKLCMQIWTRDQLYIHNLSPAEKERKAGQGVSYQIIQEPSIEFLAGEPIAKLLFESQDLDMLLSMARSMEHLALNSCAVTCSSNRYVEFNAAGVDKGQGLLDLAAYLGLRQEETLAIGDNHNDLPMLRAAGISAAPANAVAEAKACCAYTAQQDNHHGAVAEIIRRFVFCGP